MAPLHPALLAALLLSTSVVAQTTQIVWASVVYTFYGEKVPSLTSGPYNLTPLGANQMFDAGTFLRSRNIDTPDNGTQLGLTGSAIINGLSTASIDNSQMTVLSTNDEFVAGSAMAFMQGLYPPRGVPIFDGEDMLAVGTYDAFPLDNYQYPNITTVSEFDYNYIWIAGNAGCNNWDIAQAEEMLSASYVTQTNNTLSFYAPLAATLFSEYDPEIVDYKNAWLLYEYALYEYNHNPNQTISYANLTELFNMASQQQLAINTPNTFGTIPSIAGNTLASIVLQQLYHNIASGGVEDKMTLLFGSFEPFIAFSALSGLATGPSAALFNVLPTHGSLMTFELYSNAPTTSAGIVNTTFPSSDDLHVRFLYRDGTNSSTPIIEYSLFNRGNEQAEMTWADFVTDMGEFSLDDLVEWCEACNSITLFCEVIETDTSNGTDSSSGSAGKKDLSPAIGGVIGATVTLAVLLLGALIAGLCGFRLEFRGRNKAGAEAGGVGVLRRSGSGSGGGFKGAEKLASDTDLRLKGGAGASVVRHERVGSWELNDQKNGLHAGLDKGVESGRMERVVSGADYGRRSEEIVDSDPFGDPVKPLDQV